MHRGTTSRRRLVEVAELEARLLEAEATLQAIRSGEADALVVAGRDGDQIFALKGAEQPYRVLVETMNDGAVTLLPDGTIAYSNRRLAQMIRTPLEQVIGTAFETFVAPDQQVMLASLLAKASMGALQGDLTILASDGAHVPTQLALSPLQIDETRGTCLIVRDMTDRKHAERVLREQAALLDLAHDAIIVRDLQDRIVFWNKGAEDTYAWSSEQTLGQLSGALLGTTFPAPLDSIEATLHKENRWEGELRHRTRDGRTIVVASRWSLQHDEHGAPKAILEINRDITEQKQADETIRLQAAQHATMLATSSDGFWVFDLQGKLLDVNDGYCRLSGYSRQELLKLHVSDIEAMEAPQEIVRHIQKVTLSGFDRYESSHRKKNGDVMDVEISISYLHPNEQMLVFVRDITERKRAGEEIRRLNEDLENRVRLRTAELEAATAEMKSAQQIGHMGSWELDLTFLQDVNRNTLRWSDEGFRIFGYAPGEVEVTNELFFERVHPEDRAAVAAVLEKTIHQGGQYSLEHRIVLRDGSERTVQQRDDLIRDASGRPLRLVGTVQDITERKRVEAEMAKLFAEALAARAEAEAAIRLRDEFLAVAAHELKTPVSGLHAFAQMLTRAMARGGELDSARLKDAAPALDRETGKIGRLVDRLLDVSRITAGRLGLEPSWVDLTMLVGGAVEAARARAEGLRVEIELRASGPVLAWSDPLQMEQVFTNLLDNALKYAAQGRRVEVDVLASDHLTAQVRVRDFGAGIAVERRAGLFERFYQAHKEHHISGLGLGLFISRQIVEGHGGQLEAEFPIDGGTRFVVSLPRTPALAPLTLGGAVDEAQGNTLPILQVPQQARAPG